MTFTSKRLARMIAYCDANPDKIYATGYDDVISTEQANMLLKGDFDAFDESVWEMFIDYDSSFWEQEFAKEFGYDSFDDMPERVQTIAREHYTTDTTPWTRDAIRHWKGNITATLRKRDGEMIYAPSTYLDPDDTARAAYIIRAFGVELREDEGTRARRLAVDLDIVYGGYDREVATLCGRVDLWQVYESREAPVAVKVGPDDAENLLWYEHFNGCGNMGTLKLTKDRSFPAEFRVDGTYGYGVDSCYGFTGSWWNHDLRIQ